MEEKIKANLRYQIGNYKLLEGLIIEGLGIDKYLEIINLEKSEEIKNLIKERNEVQRRVLKVLGVIE